MKDGRGGLIKTPGSLLLLFLSLPRPPRESLIPLVYKKIKNHLARQSLSKGTPTYYAKDILRYQEIHGEKPSSS